MAKKIQIINGKGDFTATPPTGVDTGDWMSLESILIANEGVIDVAGDKLLVRELAAPSMKVRVNPGQCYIENSDFTADSLENKYFLFKMDSEEELDISSNASGSTRIDLICAEVDKVTSPDDTGANVALLTVVEGTPGAGAPTTPDDHLKLAEVEVGDGATSITDSDITDSRVEVVLDIDRLPVLDEDDMASNSATKLATQQSIKAYVDNRDGWQPAGETWAYAGANSLTISGVDLTSKYYKGAKIKLTQSTGGTKYFFINNSSFSTDTTINLVANETHSLANEAITSPQYSYMEIPQGFPKWMYHAVFRATQNGNVSTANGAVISFDTEIYDPMSDYDTADKRYTIPISGWYVFEVQIAVESPTDQSRYGFSIREGGTGSLANNKQKTVRLSASGTGSLYVNGVHSGWFDSGDVLDVIAEFQDTKTINGSPAFTHFSGRLISPGTNN